MKKRPLLYPLFLLLFTACQKNLTTGVGNGLLQQESIKPKIALSGPFAQDEYKISSITTQYGTDSLMSSWVGHTNYSYNTDGTLKNITIATTVPYIAPNDSILPTTTTITLDYTYGGDTVLVDRRMVNSTNPSIQVHTGMRYIKDSLGRWAKIIQQSYSPVTGAPGAATIIQLAYNSNNELISETYPPSYPGGTPTVYNYAWLNGNLSSVAPNPSTSIYDVNRYTYYTGQPCQPGDLSVLDAQQAGGFALAIPANLTQSMTTYAGTTNQFSSSIQYTYAFDSKGRINKGIYSAASSSPDSPVLRTYLIQYLNN